MARQYITAYKIEKYCTQYSQNYRIFKMKIDQTLLKIEKESLLNISVKESFKSCVNQSNMVILLFDQTTKDDRRPE